MSNWLCRGVEEIEQAITAEDRSAGLGCISVDGGYLQAFADGVALAKRDLILDGSLALQVG